MAIREFVCPVHGKFEAFMSIRELPDTYPCPVVEKEDTDNMVVEMDHVIQVATCARKSGRVLSVPGLIIL